MADFFKLVAEHYVISFIILVIVSITIITIVSFFIPQKQSGNVSIEISELKMKLQSELQKNVNLEVEKTNFSTNNSNLLVENSKLSANIENIQNQNDTLEKSVIEQNKSAKEQNDKINALSINEGKLEQEVKSSSLQITSLQTDKKINSMTK